MVVHVLVEYIFDDLGLFRNDSKRLPVANSLIAETGCRLISAAHCLFRHAAHDLAGQVDRVVFIHPLNDPLDQAAKRAIDQRLRDAHDIDAVLLLEHGLIDDRFLLIPGEPAELPDEDQGEGRLIRLRDADHLLKLRPLIRLSAGDAVLHEDILRRDKNIVSLRIVQEQPLLGVRRELFLLVSAHLTRIYNAP